LWQKQQVKKGGIMPRVKKPAKVKEPIRLRMKELADGSKSLYLDIYRDGKRTYEYLKMYIIPEIDNNARKQNQVTMNAANAIKSKRIIELTNGEAGIENREKVFLLDWMETYKENQAKRGKKDGDQIKVTIRILKDFAGERMTMDQIDKAFCQEYIDYLLTEYRPKGKRVTNFTLHTYYRILNGALNAAVRAEIIKVNPFTKINNSDKIRLPESKRSYMTIEEVKALIATPMKNEAVKHAYLFSCFCGLRVSDIIGLKWKDVFVDRGQYRLAVSMQKTKEPIYLPLSPEALKWMPERGDKMAEDHVFDLPNPSMMNLLIKPWAKAAGIDKRFTFHVASHSVFSFFLKINSLQNIPV
jgi:integrase